jgi:cell wall-associated NlpC family hydrolase
MFGFWNKDEIHYAGKFTGHQSQRMDDFDPPPNVPGWTDCSGFVTWCYKSAGAPDPNGSNYNGSGFTGTLWAHGREVTVAQLQPGDLVFYADPLGPSAHVSIYVGQGQVVSFGQESGPLLYPTGTRSDIHGFRTYPVL